MEKIVIYIIQWFIKGRKGWGGGVITIASEPLDIFFKKTSQKTR
jgi:hypothetical protein